MFSRVIQKYQRPPNLPLLSISLSEEADGAKSDRVEGVAMEIGPFWLLLMEVGTVSAKESTNKSVVFPSLPGIEAVCHWQQMARYIGFIL